MALGHDAWGLCTIFAGVGPHKIVSALADVSVIRLGYSSYIACSEGPGRVVRVHLRRFWALLLRRVVHVWRHLAAICARRRYFAGAYAYDAAMRSRHR